MDDTRFRISVTLSGGASLGAYQAGAMAALLVAVQHLVREGDDRVVIDAMGGASAGALVTMFAAHALMEGLDPVDLLRTAWVDEVSLDLLRSEGGRAPLSFDDMREGLKDVLGVGGGERSVARVAPPQPTPVALHVALTGLHGMTYPIRGMRRDGDVTGVTYADWGRFLLEPEAGPDALFEPEGAAILDFVVASASNPGGFAPHLVERPHDRDGYESRGVSNFPEHGCVWYSDGGLVQAQPIGRVLSAPAAVGAPTGPADARRVNVMIDPRSEGPSGSRRWIDPDDPPTWAEGLSRALAILPAQILYDDLRRVAKRNTRLAWAERLVDALDPHLDADAEAALDDVLAAIDEDRHAFRSDEPGLEGDRSRGGDDVPAAQRKLRRAVDEIAGLVGKGPVEVDVISPLLLAEETGEDVPGLLAGEFMGDFGGFLRRELRESDFVLGYESALVWMRRALAEAAFDDDSAAGVMDRVESGRPGDWREANRGEAGPGDLPWSARLRLARFGAHVLRVVGEEVRGGPDRRGGVRGRLRRWTGRGTGAGDQPPDDRKP